MRALFVLLVLAPSLALAVGVGGPGVVVSGSGSAAADPPACDFAYQFPGVQGGAYYCDKTAAPVMTTRASARWCEAWTGWQSVGNDVPCIGKAGLASYGAGTSYWLNSTTPTSWSFDVGASAVGQLVSDSNAAARVGAFMVDGATTGARTMSCVVKAGTLSSVRLLVSTDGTGTQTCDTTGLTNTLQRLSCTTTIGGTPTFVRATLYPGTNAADVGSVHVEQCQLERSATPGPRHDCAGTSCSWSADQHTVSTAGWPVASGEIRLQFTPNAATFAAEAKLLSAYGATNGWDTFVRTDGSIRVQSRAATVASILTSSAQTWVAGQTYELHYVWGGGTGALYRDGVLIGSGALASPGGWPALAGIGGYYFDSSYIAGNNADGHVRLVRVSN